MLGRRFRLSVQNLISVSQRDDYSTIKLTNLFTSGAIKSIDRNTSDHPSMKLDGHFSKNIFVDGVLINVITPLTIRAVLNDIKNAKITAR